MVFKPATLSVDTMIPIPIPIPIPYVRTYLLIALHDCVRI